MASALLSLRAGSCTLQRSGVATHTSSQPISVRPFTTRRPAHALRVVARAASQQAPAEQEDDSHLDDIFEGLLLEDQLLVDDEGEELVLDDGDLAAISAVDELSSTADVEALIEGALASELANGNAAEEQRLRQRAERTVAEAAAGRGSEAQQNDVFVQAASQLVDSLPEVEIEDITAGNPYVKYDEDEEAGLTKAQSDVIAQYKLSKTDLKAILPPTWDTINIDWFANKKDTSIALPEFRLNVLWMEKNIAVAVDQVYSRGQTSPMTEYFFWPRKDAWEELKISLEARPWIMERDKVVLLNRLTEIINFWQNDTAKPTLEEARVTFPDCSFASA